MKGKKRIGFKLRKGKKENKQKISIGIKSEKKIQKTVDKLILKVKQLKKY